MSTRKTTLLEDSKHDDVPAAPPSPPEAHPLAGAPTDSLRQADEPPSEATLSPNPGQPDGPAGTAGLNAQKPSADRTGCDPCYELVIACTAAAYRPRRSPVETCLAPE